MVKIFGTVFLERAKTKGTHLKTLVIKIVARFCYHVCMYMYAALAVRFDFACTQTCILTANIPAWFSFCRQKQYFPER